MPVGRAPERLRRLVPGEDHGGRDVELPDGLHPGSRLGPGGRWRLARRPVAEQRRRRGLVVGGGGVQRPRLREQVVGRRAPGFAVVDRREPAHPDVDQRRLGRPVRRTRRWRRSRRTTAGRAVGRRAGRSTGPTAPARPTAASCEWKSVAKRVTPPSTPSSTTTSASLMPAWGRALGALSIFTISTARVGAAGSCGRPVSGLASAATVGGGAVGRRAAGFVLFAPTAAGGAEQGEHHGRPRRRRGHVNGVGSGSWSLPGEANRPTAMPESFSTG